MILVRAGVPAPTSRTFVADSALYFLCNNTGNAIVDAVGGSVGGLVGGLIKGLAGGKDPGQLGNVTETDLAQAVEQMPGSFVIPAAEAEKIHHTMWFRYIKWNGQKIGAGKGLPKDLQRELSAWAQRHGVETKGLKS